MSLWLKPTLRSRLRFAHVSQRLSPTLRLLGEFLLPDDAKETKRSGRPRPRRLRRSPPRADRHSVSASSLRETALTALTALLGRNGWSCLNSLRSAQTGTPTLSRSVLRDSGERQGLRIGQVQEHAALCGCALVLLTRGLNFLFDF